MSRILAALALSLGGVVVLPASARAQNPVPGFEQGLFELVAGNLPRTVVLTLVDSSGGVLLPARTVLKVIGIAATVDSTRLSVATLKGHPILLDILHRRLVAGSDTLVMSTRMLVVSGDEVYITPAALARLVEGQVQVDFANLAVAVHRDVAFPAEQLALASARREVMVARERYEARAARLRKVEYRPDNGVGVIDWDLSTSGWDPTRSTMLGARLGAAAWGGSLVVSQRFLTGAGQGAGESLFEYHRVFPDVAWLRQLRLGDISTEGLVSRVVRGFTLSNAPENRNTEYSNLLIRPDVPTGWQYEVIQSGRLLGYSDGGAGVGVPVPVQIGGSAPVIVHMYGPAGQQVTREVVYYTPVELLPVGRFEYAAGGGSCRSSLCSNYGYADMRYGLTRKLTIGVGGERLADSAAAVARPSAELSFTTGTLLMGELRAVGDAMMGATLTGHGRATTVSLRGDVSRMGYAQLTVLPDGDRQWTGVAIIDQRLPFRRLYGLRLEGSAGGTIGLERWNAGVAASHDGGQSEVRMEAGGFGPRMLSLRSNLLMPGRLRQRRWAPIITGLVGASADAFQTAQFAVSVRAIRTGVLSASARWERRTGVHAEFGFSGTIAAVQAFIRATSAPGATMGTSSSLSGSVAFDRRGRFTPSPFSRIGFGGARGRLFRDLDGDGRFGPGDEPVADARVIVGEIPARTDEHGLYSTWGNRPYVATSVALDSLSTGDPSWITAQSETIVRLNPNVSLALDLPLIQTREVSGSVVATAGVVTSAGVTIELVPANDSSGSRVRTVTFSDGQFYFSRVRPGVYRLVLAQSSLSALNAEPGSEPSLISVPATAGNEIIDLPPLRLVPKH